MLVEIPTLSIWQRMQAQRTHPVIRKRAVFVDRVYLRDFGADRFAFEDGFLFAFGEQRYFVVHVFQHDVHGRFGRELLSSVILEKGGGGEKTSIRHCTCWMG